MIKLTCANGHRLRIGDKHAGQQAICPKCHVEVTVPELARKSITDTSVVALLGDIAPGQKVVTKAGVEPVQSLRNCPKCQTRIPTSYRLCPHCQVYIGDLSAGAAR